MIPKRIHYVWVGSALPDKQRMYIDTWHKTNPDFEIVCWNEANIDFSVPMIKTAYEQRKWAKVADVVRLMAVRDFGGIYFDTDFKLYKPLGDLLHAKCFYAFQHAHYETDLVGNGAFGAEPRHWFIHKALSRLLEMGSSPLERPTAFGPKLITALLREEGLSDYSATGVHIKDVVIHPKQMFYPFSWEEEFSKDCISDETVACHFWERSWEKDLPPMVRIFRKAKTLARYLPYIGLYATGTG